MPTATTSLRPIPTASPTPWPRFRCTTTPIGPIAGWTSASACGWTRFGPAEDWLRKSATTGTGTLRVAFDEFLQSQAPNLASGMSDDQRRELFDLFLRWQGQQ